MERVKSKKAVTPATVDRVVQKLAKVVDAPLPETVVQPAPQKRVPARPARDPADMPSFNMDKYGKAREAFTMGKLVVSVREKADASDGTVCLYFAGAILVGVLTASPVMVTANWNNRQAVQFKTVRDAEADLRTRLQATL